MLKKLSFFFILFANLQIVSLAQQSPIKGRKQFRMDISNMASEISFFDPDNFRNPEFLPLFNTELIFGINRTVELGVSLGHYFPRQLVPSDFSPTNLQSYNQVRTYGLRYGALVNIHLLPLFFDAERLRFDVYTSFKTWRSIDFGSRTQHLGQMYLSACLMGGVAYYFNPNWGVYAEYRLINYGISSNFRLGMSINLKK